jgi:hypothetical protein
MAPHREWKDPTGKFRVSQLNNALHAESNVCKLDPTTHILSVFLPLVEAEGPPPLRDAYIELLEKHWGGNPCFSNVFDAAYQLYETARQSPAGQEAWASANHAKALDCGIEHDNGHDHLLQLTYRPRANWGMMFQNNGIPPFLAALHPNKGVHFAFRTFHTRAAREGELYRWAEAISEDLVLAAIATQLVLANVPNKAKYGPGAVLASLFPGWADAVGIKPRLLPRRLDVDRGNKRLIERLLDKARLIQAHAVPDGNLRLVRLCYNETYTRN